MKLKHLIKLSKKDGACRQQVTSTYEHTIKVWMTGSLFTPRRFASCLYYTAKNDMFIMSNDLERMWLEANVACIEVIPMLLKWNDGKPRKTCHHSRPQDWDLKQKLKEALCSFSKECVQFFNHDMEMIRDRIRHTIFVNVPPLVIQKVCTLSAVSTLVRPAVGTDHVRLRLIPAQHVYQNLDSSSY